MVVRQNQSRFSKWFLGLSVASLGVILIGWLCFPLITVQGVPLTIILKFLADEPARTAYFADDSKELHDRLQDLNVENEIKDFYRPRFSDEDQLDRHIHQIFYEVSGYVGDNYVVNTQGILNTRDLHFERWSKIAKRAGVIIDSRYGDDGTSWITSPQGTVVRFDTIAPLYPINFLQKMIRSQKKK